MALIRLRVCAGWSEPLLVAHTTLLEISCRGSCIVQLFASVATTLLIALFVAHLINRVSSEIKEYTLLCRKVKENVRLTPTFFFIILMIRPPFYINARSAGVHYNHRLRETNGIF